MITNLLVDTPAGIQQIITVQDGGGYFDPTLVIFDERIHGKMDVPTIQASLGGWKRDASGALVVDATKKAAADAIISAASAADADAAQKTATRLGILKTVKAASTLADVKAILVAIVEYLKVDH